MKPEISRKWESRQEETSERFQRIKKALFSAPIYLCPERALLITEYFKKYVKKDDTILMRKAKAFRHLMQNKSAILFDDELITGNFGAHRKSALIQPELAGVFMCEDILWINKRKTTPFEMSWRDRLRMMINVIPFWLFRNMPLRALMPGLKNMFRYLMEQLNATYYLINEAGGIGHFLPNYEKIITIGIKGYLDSADKKDSDFHAAVRTACEGVVTYAHRLAEEAEAQAKNKDSLRTAELYEIARICRKVPNEPAETFHEALQSLWLSHMGVCLEGINSAVSFGRMDQYLYPFYEKDIKNGKITPEKAKELLLCFSAKTTEHVFLLSERSSKYHGGFLVAQAAIVGGIDKEGQDSVNDLSYLFLDVMEESGLREPNYQVRISRETPEPFVDRAVEVARKGLGVPAFFNDEVIVSSLERHGYPIEEARDYGIVGCVEPSIPGKSFLSTDASLFNLPICLELALNSGKRLRGGKRIGGATRDADSFQHMEEIMAAFKAQVEHMVSRLIKDIQIIEKGNRDFHPTPFSSMLVDGCLESETDVTKGGALFNGSGIQGVGVADTADSLAAIDTVLMQNQNCTIKELKGAMKDDFTSAPKLRAKLLHAPKFGNDLKLPDRYAAEIVKIFHTALSKYKNTRGGAYVPGFYSSTTHVAFGLMTGALPSGRKKGMPFAASLGTSNGMDRNGSTAILNSVAKIDGTLAPNGYALNLRFDPGAVSGEKGLNIMSSLVTGFFENNGMEVQFNIIDAEVLSDAYRNPGKYPGLVVRVAGYCAYFDDLPDPVKDEIITRRRLDV